MGKKNHTSTPSPNQDKKHLKYYGLVLEMVVLNIVFIFGGYVLDDYLETTPIFILTGTLLAMGGTIWLLVKGTK